MAFGSRRVETRRSGAGRAGFVRSDLDSSRRVIEIRSFVESDRSWPPHRPFAEFRYRRVDPRRNVSHASGQPNERAAESRRPQHRRRAVRDAADDGHSGDSRRVDAGDDRPGAARDGAARVGVESLRAARLRAAQGRHRRSVSLAGRDRFQRTRLPARSGRAFDLARRAAAGSAAASNDRLPARPTPSAPSRWCSSSARPALERRFPQCWPCSC